MLGRRRGDLAGHAAESLLNELLETPARAVARQHRQVVQMQIRIAVGVRDLLVVDLGQPVVGRDRAGVRQNEAAHGVGDGRVLLDAPVVHVDVIVHKLLIVQDRGLHVADLLALLAVEDVALGHVCIAGLAQNVLDAVLDLLDAHAVVLHLGGVVRGDLETQKVDDVAVVGRRLRVERLRDGRADLGELKIHNFSVSFYDLVHGSLSFSFAGTPGFLANLTMHPRVSQGLKTLYIVLIFGLNA